MYHLQKGSHRFDVTRNVRGGCLWSTLEGEDKCINVLRSFRQIAFNGSKNARRFVPKRDVFQGAYRKIVALNEAEIKRRLYKALDELARQSCLGVSNHNTSLIINFDYKSWSLSVCLDKYVIDTKIISLFHQLF